MWTTIAEIGPALSDIIGPLLWYWSIQRETFLLKSKIHFVLPETAAIHLQKQ